MVLNLNWSRPGLGKSGTPRRRLVHWLPTLPLQSLVLPVYPRPSFLRSALLSLLTRPRKSLAHRPSALCFSSPTRNLQFLDSERLSPASRGQSGNGISGGVRVLSSRLHSLLPPPSLRLCILSLASSPQGREAGRRPSFAIKSLASCSVTASTSSRPLSLAIRLSGTQAFITRRRLPNRLPHMPVVGLQLERVVARAINGKVAM